MGRYRGAFLALAFAATAAHGQGALHELRWADSGMSAVQNGVLRCDPGQDFQLSLQGEDASMQRVPLELYAPEVESSDPTVARAAVSSSSAHIVNVRCIGDGEAWLTAETAGKRAHFGVLVGSTRRRGMLNTPSPGAVLAVAPPAPSSVGEGAPASAARSSNPSMASPQPGRLATARSVEAGRASGAEEAVGPDTSMPPGASATQVGTPAARSVTAQAAAPPDYTFSKSQPSWLTFAPPLPHGLWGYPKKFGWAWAGTPCLKMNNLFHGETAPGYGDVIRVRVDASGCDLGDHNNLYMWWSVDHPSVVPAGYNKATYVNKRILFRVVP